MRLWPAVSWREIHNEWTDEQFNLFVEIANERQRAQANDSGSAPLSEDEAIARFGRGN